MTMNRHLPLSAAALLAAAGLALSLTLFGGAAPHPLSPAVAAGSTMETASPMLSGMSGGPVEDREADDDRLSATGMEHVPVFD